MINTTDYVSTKFQQEALKRLHKRMEAGETPADILSIDPIHSYYIDKIVQGQTPMSYLIYDRIMCCSDEDADCI